MAPVEMKKRERLATPNIVAPDQSVGKALAGLLGVVGDSVVKGSQIHAQMGRTEMVKNNAQVKKDLVAAEKEEEEITNLLAAPGLSRAEQEEVQASAVWGLGRVAASNRMGEVKAQSQYEDTAIAIANAKDTVEARQVLREQLGNTLQGVTDPAEIAGINQRFADFAPDMLEEAAKRRIERAAAVETANIDILFNDTLDVAPQNFYATVVDQATVHMASNRPVSEIVDQATVSISNFYDSGLEIGERNPNGDKALKAIDALLDDPSLAQKGDSRTRLSAVRKRIIRAEEEAISAPNAMREAIKKERFLQAYNEGQALARTGQVIPDSLYETLRENVTTVSEANNLKTLANNHEAPGMSGTQESRNARSNLRLVLGESLDGGLFDAPETRRQVAAGSAYYDRAVRQVEMIEDAGDRQIALNALGEKAVEYGRADAAERKAAADARYKTYTDEQEAFRDQAVYQSAVASGTQLMLDPEFVENYLNRSDKTYRELEAKRFNEELDSWGERYGLDVRNLAE